MNRQELSALLERLHAELSSAPQVDASIQQALQALDQDIHRLLSQGSEALSAAAAPVTGEQPDINELAQTLEARLEAEHPYLVGTLRELMDRLGKMGI